MVNMLLHKKPYLFTQQFCKLVAQHKDFNLLMLRNLSVLENKSMFHTFSSALYCGFSPDQCQLLL